MSSQGPNLLHADSEDSDQTGQMPRLICVFTWRTGHFVGFVVLWLIFMSQCQHRDWRQIHSDLSKKLISSFQETPGDIQSFFTHFSKFAFLERLNSFQYLNKSSKSCFL